MRPRFVGRLGPADVVTVANAVLGFLAVLVAPVAPRLAARFILLAAIADGLDGVVARYVRSTPVGVYLDSLSDVVSFGVAPALVVAAHAIEAWNLSETMLTPRLALAAAVPALFVGMVVVRLGLYTVYDTENHHTTGVPSTLAATVVAAIALAVQGGVAGIDLAAVLLAVAAVLTYLMVAPITYPDLLSRDAFIMGTIQGLAVLLPDAAGRTFPYALLTLAIAYLVLGPHVYWRPPPEENRDGGEGNAATRSGGEGKR